MTKDYEFYVIGDLEEDIYYLEGYVKDLVSSLYGVQPKLDIQEWCGSARLRLRSKAVVTFKHKVLGLPIGHKSNVAFPPVLRRDPELEASFIRGLADTDGCLSFADKGHLHNYPRIKVTNVSRRLLSSIKRILSTDFGLRSTLIEDSASRVTYERNYPTLALQIQGRKAISIWDDSIGFRNVSKLTRLLIWETYGFCPPGTSISQRLAVISGILHPKQLYSSCLNPVPGEPERASLFAETSRILRQRFGEAAAKQLLIASDSQRNSRMLVPRR